MSHSGTVPLRDRPVKVKVSYHVSRQGPWWRGRMSERSQDREFYGSRKTGSTAIFTVSHAVCSSAPSELYIRGKHLAQKPPLLFPLTLHGPVSADLAQWHRSPMERCSSATDRHPSLRLCASALIYEPKSDRSLNGLKKDGRRGGAE